MMKTVFVLNDAVPQRRKKREIAMLNERRIKLPDAIKILKEKGVKITIAAVEGPMVCDEFEGIPICTTLWGKVVWAKDKKDDVELMEKLTEARLFSHPCQMPVSLRQDVK